MYHFARAIDIDGVNVARVDVPDLPEYKVILAHFLRAHPDIPPDLMFEGRDSLAMAGNVSWALNRRYLRWWPAYRPAKTSRDFYPLPFRPIGPSPQQIYWAYWDLMNWFTDSRTVRVMLITFGVAGISVLFAWIMSELLYMLDVNLLGR